MSTLARIARNDRDDRPRPRRDALLLSGATGFLGTELLARYLRETDRAIFAIIRADDDAHAQQRLRETLQSAFGTAAPYSGRIRALAGDMTLPLLGLDPEVAQSVAELVNEIVHGAAAVSFDLELDRARAINVQGTAEMLEFAALCQRHGGLRRLTYISTAYVAGLHKGPFGEDDLDVGQRFRNAYEQSKFESEQLVRAHFERLPITVVRPSIIVGDSQTGWTASFNVLYWPTRALARGAFPVLPACRSSPVDVVSVDYVADAVRALAAMPDTAGHTFHLTSASDATTIWELLALACDKLDVKAPPLIAPALYLRVLGPLLRRLRPRRRAFLEAAATYVPYFAVRAQFDDARARQALGTRLRPKPLGEYYETIIDFALQTRWGARPMTRAAAARDAGIDPSRPRPGEGKVACASATAGTPGTR